MRMGGQKERNRTPTVSPNAMPLAKVTQRWKLGRNTRRCNVYHAKTVIIFTFCEPFIAQLMHKF